MAVLLGLADVLFQLNLVDFLSAFIDSFLPAFLTIDSRKPHQGNWDSGRGDFMNLFS
jgi:hypothetical protein